MVTLNNYPDHSERDKVHTALLWWRTKQLFSQCHVQNSSQHSLLKAYWIAIVLILFVQARCLQISCHIFLSTTKAKLPKVSQTGLSNISRSSLKVPFQCSTFLSPSSSRLRINPNEIALQETFKGRKIYKYLWFSYLSCDLVNVAFPNLLMIQN